MSEEYAGYLYLIVLILVLVMIRFVLPMIRWRKEKHLLREQALKRNGKIIGGRFTTPKLLFNHSGQDIIVYSKQYRLFRRRLTYAESSFRLTHRLTKDAELTVFKEDAAAKQFKAAGMPDIEIGNTEFDDAFVIRANDESLARKLLTPEVQQKLLSLGFFILGIRHGILVLYTNYLKDRLAYDNLIDTEVLLVRNTDPFRQDVESDRLQAKTERVKMSKLVAGADKERRKTYIWTPTKALLWCGLGVIPIGAAIYAFFIHSYTFPPKESLVVFDGVIQQIEVEEVRGAGTRFDEEYYVSLLNHPDRFKYEHWFPEIGYVFEDELRPGDKARIWAATKDDNWICQLEGGGRVLIRYDDVKEATESHKSMIVDGVIALLFAAGWFGTYFFYLRKL